jgi:hypothetical protein
MMELNEEKAVRRRSRQLPKLFRIDSSRLVIAQLQAEASDRHVVNPVQPFAELVPMAQQVWRYYGRVAAICFAVRHVTWHWRWPPWPALPAGPRLCCVKLGMVNKAVVTHCTTAWSWHGVLHDQDRLL